MRLHALALLVLLAPAAPGHGETVYRCPGPDGGTIYRDSACDEGEAIELPPLNEGEGLRPGERELLRELRAPEPEP
ncbi:MAG: hypothetical protein R3202_09820, partial [Candidatus Competibacterales bacterium]|nr:hypothetical protein [Candidatus Competibacterales bacterium]